MSEARTTRRDFLAAGATMAAAGLFSGGVFAADTSSDKPIRVGVVGCGGRGRGAAADSLTADKRVQIVAIADAFEFRHKEFIDEVNKQKGLEGRIDGEKVAKFAGLDAYKKVVESECEYVILATPPGFRPLHLEAAVNAGKNIFTEKPAAADVTGVRKVLDLVKTAEDKKLHIVAGTQRRHNQGYIQTVKQLQDGAIGDITSARCYWNNTNDIWYRPRTELKKFGIPDTDLAYHAAQLVPLHVDERRPHRRAAHSQSGRDQLGAEGPPDPGDGHGRPGQPAERRPEGGGQHLRPLRGRIRIPERRVRVELLPAAEQLHGQHQRGRGRHQGPVPGERVRHQRQAGRQQQRAQRDYVQEHFDLIESIRGRTERLNELKQVAESTFTAILGRMATYGGKELTWDDVLLKSKEDTMPKDLPKDLTEDVKIEVPPAPIVGKYKAI